MTDPYVEAIANGYAAFNARDAEAILATLDEGIEYRMPLDPTRRYPPFSGHDGVRGFYAKLWGTFTEYRAEIATVNHVGDVVIVVGRMHIRINPGDEERLAAFAHFWRIVGGKVVSVSFHDAVNPFAFAERQAAAS